MLARWFGSMAFVALLTLPREAHACWDGWSAEVGRVRIAQAGASDWTPQTARVAAMWGSRIDALLRLTTSS